MSQPVEPKKESKNGDDFSFGDMKLYLNQARNGNRYVTVFIGKEKRFYELEMFIGLITKFQIYAEEKMKVQNSQNEKFQK